MRDFGIFGIPAMTIEPDRGELARCALTDSENYLALMRTSSKYGRVALNYCREAPWGAEHSSAEWLGPANIQLSMIKTPVSNPYPAATSRRPPLRCTARQVRLGRSYNAVRRST
jgi:hypothetical protein